MFKKNILLVCLAASICLHILFYSNFSFYFTTSSTPSIFSWPKILAKEDLMVVNRPFLFDKTIDLTRAPSVDKLYFIQPLDKPLVIARGEKTFEPLKKNPENIQQLSNYNVKETDYIYLWEKPKSLIGWERETIQYKAFVSPYGKVILSFPTKLPVNSSGNMSSQDYAREAAMFLKDKFLWTKVEAVVR